MFGSQHPRDVRKEPVRVGGCRGKAGTVGGQAVGSLWQPLAFLGGLVSGVARCCWPVSKGGPSAPRPAVALKMQRQRGGMCAASAVVEASVLWAEGGSIRAALSSLPRGPASCRPWMAMPRRKAKGKETPACFKDQSKHKPLCSKRWFLGMYFRLEVGLPRTGL